MAEKDRIEKTLEAYNDVFADIMNGLLFQGQPVVSADALTDAFPFSVYKADGDIHEQERDVSKYWIEHSGEKTGIRLAFFGVENQTAYDRDMPLRVIGYDGAVYRAEMAGKDRYPVLTLVLYFGDTRWKKNRRLYDAVNVPEKLKPFVNDYPIHIFEIAYLTEEQVQYFRSDFRIVADYFSKKRTNADYRPADDRAFQHVDELLKLFSVLTRDPRFAATLRGRKEKPKNMCEVLDRVEARGIKKGREIGERRGERRGVRKGRLQTLAKLVKDKNLPLEIGAQEAGLSVEEFRKAAGLSEEK